MLHKKLLLTINPNFWNNMYTQIVQIQTICIFEKMFFFLLINFELKIYPSLHSISMTYIKPCEEPKELCNILYHEFFSIQIFCP